MPIKNGWRSIVITALLSIVLTGATSFVLVGANKVSHDDLDRQLVPLADAVTQLQRTTRDLEVTVAVLNEQVRALRQQLRGP